MLAGRGKDVDYCCSASFAIGAALFFFDETRLALSGCMCSLSSGELWNNGVDRV